MDTHALKVLEYREVVDLLKFFASSELTVEHLGAIEPLTNAAAIRLLFRELAELQILYSQPDAPPRPNAGDCRELLEKVRIAGVALEPQMLLSLASFLAHSRELKRFLDNHQADFPLLAGIAMGLIAARVLEDSIHAAIDDHGEVRDDASPELARLRRSRRKLAVQIRARVASVVQRLSGSEILQDELATLRNNRLVIPVKIEERRQIKGIIHDQSSSGATLFIEPEETIVMNNALVSVQSRERAEVHRILVELSDRVRAIRELLAAAQAAMVRLDIIYCKAAFARQYEAAIPAITITGSLVLENARHPLLIAQAQADPSRIDKPVVPLDMELEASRPVMVISGPNAGGKTVALKTIGLLVLLAQSGIPITAAAASQVPLFTSVFADIGDEQSIEASLSTFSAHIMNLNRVLAGADANSLVVLDELGAGTDPDQGGALGIAILEELVRRRTHAVATTHHDRIKIYAEMEPAIVNSCMEFDEVKLQPTYRLHTNKIGKSYTFIVAQGLGLPNRLIQRANELLDRRDLDREELINFLEAKRLELDRLLGENKIYREDASKLYERRKQELEQGRVTLSQEIARARGDAVGLLREVRSAFDRLLAKAKQEGITKESRQEFNRVIAEAREYVDVILPAAAPDETAAGGEVAVGSRVWVTPLHCEGDVESLSLDNEQVQVKIGGKRVTVELKDVRVVAAQAPPKEAPQVAWNTAELEEAPPAPSRLHLLGYRVHEAEHELERYLDSACRNHLAEVAIVHGFGTGRLQKAVVQYLKRHPQVVRFRVGEPHEGGGGVTVVTLKV